MRDFLDLLKAVGTRTALSQLIPGIVVAWLLLRPVQTMLAGRSVRDLVIVPDSKVALWLGFVILAWIIGSLLKLIGSVLDRPVYDWLFKQIVKRGRNDLLQKAKETIHQDLGSGIDWSKFDYFNYAVTFIKEEGIGEGIREVDEYVGNSKLFRTLGVTLLAVFGILVIRGQTEFAIGALAFSLAALWNFCADRWNSTQRAYEYYIVRRLKQGPKAILNRRTGDNI